MVLHLLFIKHIYIHSDCIFVDLTCVNIFGFIESHEKATQVGGRYHFIFIDFYDNFTVYLFF